MMEIPSLIREGHYSTQDLAVWTMVDKPAEIQFKVECWESEFLQETEYGNFFRWWAWIKHF